jgi:hypothetical protein
MKTGFAFCLLAVTACNSRANDSTTDPAVGEAQAAIHALESRDSDAVAACDRLVDACQAKAGDAGSGHACEWLDQHCEELADTLARVRGPAVACWREVLECVHDRKTFSSESDAGPDAGGSCSVTPRDCVRSGDDSDEDRSPVLECGQAVHECVQSLKQHDDDSRQQCAEVRDDCHHICGAAVAASDDRQNHAGHGGRLRTRLHELLDGLHEHRHGGHHGEDPADAGSR